MNKPTGVTYEIRTLADIFKLPTADAMERCLKELGEMMGSTRAYAELVTETARHIAKKDGIELPAGPAFAWPEVVKWTDDGGLVCSEIRFNGPDGEAFSTLRIQKA